MKRSASTKTTHIIGGTASLVPPYISSAGMTKKAISEAAYFHPVVMTGWVRNKASGLFPKPQSYGAQEPLLV